MKRAACIRIAMHDDHVHLVLVGARGEPIGDALLNMKEALRIGDDLIRLGMPEDARAVN